MRTSTLLAALALAAPSAAPAQRDSIPERRLTTPEAEFPGTFSSLRGLREQSSGRILVSDWIEEELLVLDFGRGTRTAIGKVGRGPAEYRLPSRLLPLPGDTTLLWDEGNQRLQLISPDYRLLGVVPPPAGRQFPVSPGGADALGNLYFVTPNWASGDARGDSLRLNRWDRRTGTVRQIARLHGNAPFPPHDGPRRTPTIPFVMFSPADAWVALPDGSVRIVRSGDYSIEALGPDGTARRGPSWAWPTRPVTPADRTWYVRRFLSQSPVSGRGPDGGMGRGPSEHLTDEFIQGMVRTNGFADRMPYFTGAIWLAPGGDLLVQRSPGSDREIRLDRFNAQGRLVERLVLPPGRTVAGVGARSLYLVRVDDDELQRLERYGI